LPEDPLAAPRADKLNLLGFAQFETPSDQLDIDRFLVSAILLRKHNTRDEVDSASNIKVLREVVIAKVFFIVFIKFGYRAIEQRFW
jgi:hypothetical protein